MHAFGEWLYTFSTSAGFGGIAAVVAALIAYRGVRRSAAVARQNARSAQWWENARGAADRLLSADNITPGEDDNRALLTDRDARAAITTLHHLGENAPSDIEAAFVQEVLGVVLEVDSGETPAQTDDQDSQEDEPA